MSLSDAIRLHRDIVSLLQSGHEELALERFNSIWPVIESHVIPMVAPPPDPDRVVLVIPPSPTASPTPSRCSSPTFSVDGINSSEDDDDSDDGVRSVVISTTNANAGSSNVNRNSTVSFTIQCILPQSHASMTALPWKEMEDINAMMTDSGLDEGNYNDDNDVDFNVFSRFTRVFAFNTNTDAVLTLGEWLRCMLSLRVVLYYHVGLAHHAMAERRSGHDSHALYDLALQFYHRAQQIHFILVHASGNGSGAGNEYDTHQLDIVALAIYNNMGHCYAHFGSTARAVWCFDQLLVLFCASLQRWHAMSADELVFFQDRIQLGMAKRQRPAPAA